MKYVLYAAGIKLVLTGLVLYIVWKRRKTLLDGDVAPALSGEEAYDGREYCGVGAQTPA